METDEENINGKLLESALLEKLNLSIEERIDSHENARRLVNELKVIGEQLRARSEEAS